MYAPIKIVILVYVYIGKGGSYIIKNINSPYILWTHITWKAITNPVWDASKWND